MAQGHLECFFELGYGKSMESKKTPSAKSNPAQRREDRLKAALKANMSRRKAQAKARSAPAEGQEAESQDKG